MLISRLALMMDQYIQLFLSLLYALHNLVDIMGEIDRIKQDMNVEKNGVPVFWKHIKDYKAKIGDIKFNTEKINKKLKCPMNYLMDLKFEHFKSADSTLPMEYFFQKFDLSEDRRKCRRIERELGQL